MSSLPDRAVPGQAAYNAGILLAAAGRRERALPPLAAAGAVPVPLGAAAEAVECSSLFV